MKALLSLTLILLFPLILFSQSLHTAELKPGTWAGNVVHENQTTRFYLDLKHNDDGELTARTMLPIIPFPVADRGVIRVEDSMFKAGNAVQFQYETDSAQITGSYFGFRFVLYPADQLPEVPEPVSSTSTASPVWTFSTEGPVWGGATTDMNRVYIGSADGTLYVLSQTTGDLIWSFETKGAIFSRPLIHENHVYVLSDDGNLYKLNAEDGSLKWTFETDGHLWTRRLPDGENPGYDSMGSSAAISHGIVYVGSANGKMYAINKQSGREVWHFETDGPIHSRPVVADNKVYFGSYDHHIYAVDAANGNEQWRFNTGQLVLSSPVLTNGKIIIGSRSAYLFALNAQTGLEEWNYFHWGSWVESSGTVYDDQLYIGSSDDQLLKVIQPTAGTLLWEANLGGSPWSTPAVTEQSVFTGTFGNTHYNIDHRGGFFALDRLTGEQKWRYMWEKQPENQIYGVVSSPATANGMVFFGGLDGIVYGFKQ